MELLANLPGDPDIVLWNGHVGDYQDLSKEIVKSSLVKQTKKSYLSCIKHEKMRDANDFNVVLTESEVAEYSKSYNKHVEWELNPWVTDEQIQRKLYTEKVVYCLQPKLRGKTDYNRSFSMEY